MAAVKLSSGGSVILKNGKVSCACCTETCCMYPAQGLLDEDYTEDDLPDDITLNGSSKSRSGSSYGNTTDGVIYESGVWAVYVGGVRSTQSCLITGDGNFTPGDDSVEDQFSATYTVNINGFNIMWPENVEVTRVSLCVWTGVGYLELVPYYYKLEYRPNGYTPDKWWISVDDNEEFGFGSIGLTYPKISYWGDPETQSSPVGVWSVEPGDESYTITVSEP